MKALTKPVLTWSYPKLDGTIRPKPLLYHRLPTGEIVRLYQPKKNP